jgi:hypothetical protein
MSRMIEHRSNTGRTAVFRMRPRWGFLWLAVFVFVIGFMGVLQLKEVAAHGDIHAESRASLVWALTIILSGLLVIIATARMWFPHLWHRRR